MAVAGNVPLDTCPETRWPVQGGIFSPVACHLDQDLPRLAVMAHRAQGLSELAIWLRAKATAPTRFIGRQLGAQPLQPSPGLTGIIKPTVDKPVQYQVSL